MITNEAIIDDIVHELWKAISDKNLCPNGTIVSTPANLNKEEVYGELGSQNLPWCIALKRIVKRLFPETEVCLYSNTTLDGEYAVAVKIKGKDVLYSPARSRDELTGFLPSDEEFLKLDSETSDRIDIVVNAVVYKLSSTPALHQEERQL